MKSLYDIILLDSPPIAAVTDSVIMSRFVDGVVLVIHGGSTRIDVIKQSRDSLQKANAHLLGVVINNIDLAKRSYYYYYQYYNYQYYGGDERKPKRRKKRKKPISNA